MRRAQYLNFSSDVRTREEGGKSNAPNGLERLVCSPVSSFLCPKASQTHRQRDGQHNGSAKCNWQQVNVANKLATDAEVS